MYCGALRFSINQRLVRGFKTVTVLLMVTNWFACALHCQMESTGLLHQAAAGNRGAHGSAHVTMVGSHSDGDVCSWMADGGLNVPDCRLSLPQPLVTLIAAAVQSSDSTLAILFDEPLVPGRWSLAPPELRSSIHFADRTALPARAPSSHS